MNYSNRNQNSVILSLGTNLGDKESNLKKAMLLIEENAVIKNKSKLYISEPWGYSSNNDFINMGILINTHLAPLELLSFIKGIELKMGRIESKDKVYQDRIIDLDILLYNDLELFSKELVIPHPKIKDRIFSIIILKDLFKDDLIPVFNQTATEILENTNDKSVVTINRHQL